MAKSERRFQMKLAGHGKKLLVCDSFHGRTGGFPDAPCFFFSDGRGDYDGAWLIDPDDFAQVAAAFLEDREKGKGVPHGKV